MNTHDIEQERQKFEAFMREKNPSHDLEHEFGIYRFSPVQRHWDTWQAAIEADRKRRGEPSALLARIAELEAQLEAIGAGGVTQSQPLMPSRTPEISGNSGQLDADHG